MKQNEWIALAVCASVLTALIWAMLRRRVSPAERERIRRLTIAAQGRLTDGYLAEFEPPVLHYSYTVAGMEYFAAQDVSAISGLHERSLAAAAGPVSVKYDQKNPANSIVVSERWSGLRHSHEKEI